jgi:hypothetical protein
METKYITICIFYDSLIYKKYIIIAIFIQNLDIIKIIIL